MIEDRNGAAPDSLARPAGAPALHGVRVTDLTQFEAGTSCTETLAWLGAEVIKVEEPTKGEQGRNASAAGDSFYFMVLNANKRSVTANLKHEKGKAILRSLIEKSDVFIENFAPGAIERLGFGWDVVKEINPRIIYASIKGFPPQGPYGKFLSFDTVAQCTGGSVSVTGEPDGVPMRPGVTIGDTGTGLHCVIGIVSALYQRQFTGLGQRIEITMQEAVTNFGRVTYAAMLQAGGRPQPRNGNTSMIATSPSDIYPCKGGGKNDYAYVYSTRINNSHWDRLVKVMGREDLIDNPRFANAALRYENRAEVNEMVSNWTLQHDKITVMKILGEAGVPVGAVLDTKEISEDPHLRERETFVTIKHPVRGEFTMPGFPLKMSSSHVPVEPAPLLGAHTDKIYQDLLGLGRDALDALREEKVI